MLPGPRAALLAQHAHLRHLIDAAHGAATAVLALEVPSEQAVEAMQSAIVAMRGGLLPHLDAEEQVLGPLLQAMPEDGTLRLALLRAEHTSQRALLDLLARAAAMGPKTCARRTLAFVGELRDDMRFEETELFELVFPQERHDS